MSRPNTKEKILRAGLKGMYANGYHASSVESITKAASLPKGSFYNHFSSKEALAVAAVGEYFAEHRRHLDAMLRNDDGSPLVRLRAYFDGLSDVLEAGAFKRGCMLGNFGLELSDHSPAVQKRVAELLDGLTVGVEECLRQAQQYGEIPPEVDLRSLAEFTVNAWEGAILRMKVDKTARPLLLFREFIFERYLRHYS